MLYFVRDFNGNSRLTDEEHLDDCIWYSKQDWNVKKVIINKAVICFDGYFVNSDYIGER